MGRLGTVNFGHRTCCVLEKEIVRMPITNGLQIKRNYGSCLNESATIKYQS